MLFLVPGVPGGSHLCGLRSRAARPPLPAGPMPDSPQQDPFLWLEDVDGDRSLEWVRARNAESEAALTRAPRFAALRDRLLSILDSDERIAHVAKRGPHYYNFWQDAANPRGLWRRTTWASYRTDSPEWEVVLDLDALGASEGENWVWKGATWLRQEPSRCLVSLSRGGADAAVVREFDPAAKAFVDGGFELEEAKSSVAWIDHDTVFVGTDFGPDSMTDSGYPRVVKRWRRGASLADAETVAEGRADDVFVYGFADTTPGFEREFLYRAMTFYTNEMSVLGADGPIKIDKPDSATAAVHREWLLFELREDWEVAGKRHAAGSLLVIRFEDFLAGDRDLHALFTPTERTSLSSWAGTRHHLLVNVLDNVRNVVYSATPGDDGWSLEPLPGLPEYGTITAAPVDDEVSDDYWLTVTDFLTPTSLWRGAIGAGPAEPLKSLPAYFDVGELIVEQQVATSADGERVPYFLICRADARCDGANPTLLYGYGGFEVSLTPAYSATVGAAWLEEGGVYAVANIRGGGEFGPRWHQAALKANRDKSYQDFAAVARDLIRREVT